MSKRTLAAEALYSSHNYRPEPGGSPDNIPAMNNATRKHLEKIDPGGRRARKLIREFARKNRKK